MIDSLTTKQQVIRKEDNQTAKDTSQHSKQHTDNSLDNCPSPIPITSQPISHLPLRKTKSTCHMTSQEQPDDVTQLKEVPEASNNKQTFELIVGALMQLGDQLSRFSKDVQNFESRLNRLQSQNDQNSNKHQRKLKKRSAQQVNKYECRIQDCRKSYASNLSLKLHQKLKHPTINTPQNVEVPQNSNAQKPN